MRNCEIKIILVLFVMLSIMACGNDASSDPSEQELTFENLAGQWSLPISGGIVVDGVDQSLNYPGFNLSFTNGRYTTANAGTLFQSSGTWEWVDQVTTSEIVLDDGKNINIQDLSTSEFVFSFTHTTGGVRNGVNGSYVVSLNK